MVTGSYTKNRPPLAWALFWLLWVLAGVIAEIWAFVTAVRGNDGTLSQVVWYWLTGRSKPAPVPASAFWAWRIILLGFFAWLGVHLSFGILA